MPEVVNLIEKITDSMTVNNTPGQLYVALSRVVARNTTWVL